ncbi:MAG: tRNA 4-thiouridine(8) synthase ThiI [Erysipelotrichaceae bacterium]|jgi:thiamine biosynthesis protein ThiI|uniref:Probable tRNA sulfurtransferase n=1 Tax=Grylomicrobium aquisgranensis TaxID=2926318 RepID=A0AB35U6G2_9FIRM|nr:tRNA uracil 4-sulfurtransferase ThiI [Lactimicrobium massiliense]MCH4019870.1 tRNA 4-thiouridine(8) synthase ThiI [Erysipelotrichaceae bacterium]MCI1326426.1 tRNA 4-thiouridine(8) synthase ThiI [Solobacterium sp.]MDX8420112.1 tRNA 4-thiouridine(8) synthase ThiI [Stecheria sp. CLA-KB-P133]MCH4045136.1 tRNA 4-thiouridine(8) synthase ThiI [Erysipelotrichaceae bacterium]MCH4122347.1 tRNA 4-thiouridine(8) synthase ThiI [Erysipelotrichaceae bacterium]
MVKYDTVLIRYGELSTKGKNRKDFIRRLDRNIRYMLRDFKDLQYKRTYDRIYIKLQDEDPEEIAERLKKVFGISSFSFTERVDSDIDAITARCLEIAKETDKKTFKMLTKRHDKTFPMVSDAVNRHIAGVILDNTDLQVDVHNPQLLIRVEIHENDTYITSDKIPGAGGYPAGINGKVLLLLSGGIDSPVAAYELMKRGIEVEAVHFASPPYTSQAARDKVAELARLVSIYQGRMKIHYLNFTDIQLAIYKAAGDPYAVTLMRRMMFRLAEMVAKQNNCLALGTGESVGQVASQTLSSMAVINDVIRIPVLRPLVCFDKVEIIDLARRIGTYETSILPYEDCCTIFDPKNPVTNPTIHKSEYYESKFDWQTMLEKCVAAEETVTVRPETKDDFL